jgi:hypothetical protein
MLNKKFNTNLSSSGSWHSKAPTSTNFLSLVEDVKRHSLLWVAVFTLGLWVLLSTLNSTPYDAKPMTRGLGCLLGITKQRTFTSNLLPIYLGALDVHILSICLVTCNVQ